MKNIEIIIKQIDSACFPSMHITRTLLLLCYIFINNIITIIDVYTSFQTVCTSENCPLEYSNRINMRDNKISINHNEKFINR